MTYSPGPENLLIFSFLWSIFNSPLSPCCGYTFTCACASATTDRILEGELNLSHVRVRPIIAAFFSVALTIPSASFSVSSVGLTPPPCLKVTVTVYSRRSKSVALKLTPTSRAFKLGEPDADALTAFSPTPELVWAVAPCEIRTLTGTAETTAASPRTMKGLLKRMVTESGR
ncbi:hypothetical protein HHX47_DHR4001072 [Lentinula edodes]|nr:hypothetical protein HHX47_DHR4001072 [Lentinula edodes]